MADFRAYEDYLRYELNRSPLTVRAYLADLEEFAAFIEGLGNGAFDPALVSLADVRLWLGHIGERGAEAATLRRKTQSLRAYFKYLRRIGAVAANPAARVVPARMPSRLPEIVKPEEMEQLLADFPAGPDYKSVLEHLIVNMLYCTGMRRAELASLTDAAVDTSALELRVTGKRSKTRIIPLSPDLAREIEDYREARDREHPSCAGSGWFLVWKGKPVNVNKIYTVVRQRLALTHAGRKSPHVLRHTFATGMLNNGAEINSVKELLGHSSLESTQIYTHLSFADLRRNYQGAHPRTHKEGEKD